MLPCVIQFMGGLKRSQAVQSLLAFGFVLSSLLAKAWNAERDANEPAKVKLFRASLLHCTCVVQLFDPWYMDANTKAGQNPEPNMQKTSNETLHAHHLHVTVFEPKIL